MSWSPCLLSPIYWWHFGGFCLNQCCPDSYFIYLRCDLKETLVASHVESPFDFRLTGRSSSCLWSEDRIAERQRNSQLRAENVLFLEAILLPWSLEPKTSTWDVSELRLSPKPQWGVPPMCLHKPIHFHLHGTYDTTRYGLFSLSLESTEGQKRGQI